MIDGTIARKLGTESKFGRNFDTIADIVFVASSAYKLFPEFKIPRVIWLWISIIAVIKIINIISGFVRKKKFTAVLCVVLRAHFRLKIKSFALPTDAD